MSLPTTKNSGNKRPLDAAFTPTSRAEEDEGDANQRSPQTTDQSTPPQLPSTTVVEQLSPHTLDDAVFTKVLNYHTAFKKIHLYYQPAGVCIDKLYQEKKYEMFSEIWENDDDDDDDEDDEEDNVDESEEGIDNDEDEDENDDNKDSSVANNVIAYDDLDDDDEKISSDVDDNLMDNKAKHYKEEINSEQCAIINLIKDAVSMEKVGRNVAKLRHVVCLKNGVFGYRNRSLTIRAAATDVAEKKNENDNKTETIKVDRTSVDYADSGDLAKHLWEMAPVKEGAYGDIRHQETKVDRNVRNARDYLHDLGHFSCSASLLKELTSNWSDNMYPYKVDLITVVPYKINCYDPQGCFVNHVDTPDVDMAGTILVGLGQTDTDGSEQGSTGASHLRLTDNRAEQTWDPKFGNVCMFYSDVSHTVVANGRYRATAAFKVFSKNRMEKIHQTILTRARRILPQQRPIGFLFSRRYTLDSTAMKGIDGIFNEIVHQSGLYEDIKLVTVLVKTGRVYDNEFVKIYSNVYIVTNERIERICRGKKRKQRPNAVDAIRGIDFYRITSGYRWVVRREDDEPDFNGNKSRAGDLNSIYLHKALIAFPKKQNVSTKDQVDAENTE